MEALPSKVMAILRPTSDRVREALFDILGPELTGARVLDQLEYRRRHHRSWHGRA